MCVVWRSGAADMDHRPVTPNPEDRKVSKRDWEQKVLAWKGQMRRLTWSGSMVQIPHDVYDEVLTAGTSASYYACLIHALNAFDLQLPLQPGPHWALRDGNALLAPLNLMLLPMPSVALLRRGWFVLHKEYHFFAVKHGDSAVRIDQGVRGVLTALDLTTLVEDGALSIFEVMERGEANMDFAA
eukprot:6131009-Karenia_brevis.AAC.1